MVSAASRGVQTDGRDDHWEVKKGAMIEDKKMMNVRGIKPTWPVIE